MEDGKVSLIEAGTVVLALSMKPRIEVFDQLSRLAPVFLAVGDCVRSGKIGDAIHDAANKIVNLAGGYPSRGKSLF